MSKPTDVRELREWMWEFSVEILRGVHGDGDPYRPSMEDADTVREAVAALERLEKLEDELRLCRSFHEVAVRQRDSAWAEVRALREYYDAAEQAEYAGRQLGTAAQAQAASRLETARAALRATPAAGR